MMFQIIIAVTLAVLLLLRYWLYRYSDVNRVPVPDGASFVWGHDKQIYEEKVGEAYRKWHDAHGNVIRVRGAFWHPSILSIADPAALKHILVSNIYDYHHSKIVRPRIERLLGRGLGWVEGANEHKRMRRLVAPSLATGNIKAMTQAIYDVSRGTSKKFHDFLEIRSGTAQVNILDWTQKTVIMISGLFNFNFDFEAGESEHATEILSSWRNMACAMMQPRGFRALVLLRRFPFLNKVPIQANLKHLAVKTTIEREVGDALWRKAQGEDIKEETDRPKSLLSILAGAVKEGKIDRQEMLDHITMFMVGGFETTAQVLAYTLWQLGSNPDKQEILRQELSTFPGEPTYEDYTHKLPYLDAVCRETLRLNPSLPYMERVATREDVLPLSTPIQCADGTELTSLRIKAGQIIVIPIISIHKMQTYFHNPTAFIPERWLGPSEKRMGLPKTWSNLLSFSDGPRQCIGLQLALFQYKIVLREFLLRFDFSAVEGISLGSKVGSSMQPYVQGELDKGPRLPLNVSARKVE